MKTTANEKTKPESGESPESHGFHEQEIARLRGDLLTMARRISHDLRTPLGGIITTAESLKEQLADTGAPTAAADALLQSADEISRLVKRVNLIAKASATPTAKQPVLMAEIVWSVLQQLERRILKRRATVTEPKSWPEVPGVAAWLEAIWWNLLANALQHAGDAPRIEIGWQSADDRVRFWVRDNGPGVPEARGSKLFQPFESLHELDSARGLGLPIVRRLVELQGGACGYEPNPGGGACFFFTLPEK